MPGDDGISPFKVRREFEDTVAAEKEIECGSDSSDGTHIDPHFEEFVEQREASHSEAVSGIIVSVLREYEPIVDYDAEHQDPLRWRRSVDMVSLVVETKFSLNTFLVEQKFTRLLKFLAKERGVVALRFVAAREYVKPAPPSRGKSPLST